MEQFESASILCGIICLPLGLALSPFLDLMRGSIFLMYKRALQGSRFAGKRSRLCRECAVYACVALSLCLAYAFWFCWLSEERVDRIPWYFGMHNAGFLWWFVPASYQACGNVATASVLHIIHSVQDRLMHLQLLLTKVSQRMSKSRQQEAQSLRKSLSRLMQKNYWNEIDVFSDLCLPKWFRLEVNIVFLLFPLFCCGCLCFRASQPSLGSQGVKGASRDKKEVQNVAPGPDLRHLFWWSTTVVLCRFWDRCGIYLWKYITLLKITY